MMITFNAVRRSLNMFLLLFVAAIGLASEKKEWVKLTDCAYVAADYNDGDSFRVKAGTNEFVVRLYFVDAPETNLRYPERTREQSEYFGVTLDEAMKAGAEARETARELLLCGLDALVERIRARQGDPVLRNRRDQRQGPG